MVLSFCMIKNTKNRKKPHKILPKKNFHVQKTLQNKVFFEHAQFDPLGKEILFDG